MRQMIPAAPRLRRVPVSWREIMCSRRALRLVAMFLAVGVLGIAFAVAPQGARADANAPRWSAGDFWLYADASNPNSTLRVDVVARENAQTLLGNTYDAFHLRETASGGAVSLMPDSWVRDSDLGIVKISITIWPVHSGPIWTLTLVPRLSRSRRSRS